MNKIEALHYYAQEVKDIKEAGCSKVKVRSSHPNPRM